jgi:GR25 family glycosyltransferase involved in LPS biosynthesis
MNGSSDRCTATNGRRRNGASSNHREVTTRKSDGLDCRGDFRLLETKADHADVAERVCIVVISLAGSPRRKRIAEQMAGMPLPWSFFDAQRALHDDQPAYDTGRALRYWGRPLTQSEIGCAASHLAVLKAASQKAEGEWTLVIEDDVLLDPAFDFAGAARICKIAGLQYLRLYARHLAKPVHVIWLGQRELVRFKRAPMGTQAYLISPDAARNFLRSFRRLDRPIDWEMDRFWANGLLNYAIFPFPCLELGLASSVAKIPSSGATPGAVDRLVWVAWKLYQRTLRTVHNIYLRRSDASIRKVYASQEEMPEF